jgi:hypothetical protein
VAETVVSIEPVMTGWCWALLREPDNRWSLRQRDWRTGELSEPLRVSDEPMEPYRQAVDWAAQ